MSNDGPTLKSSKINVTIVGPESANSGGMAQYVTEQQRHLNKRVEIELHNIAAVRTESSDPFDMLWVYVQAIVRSIFEMIWFMQKQPTDILHVHTAQSIESIRSTFYVLYGSYIWKSKVVLHIHGSSYDEFVMTDSHIFSAIQSILFDTADSVVVISERLKRVLASRVAEKRLFLLPNAVTVNDYNPAPQSNPPNIVFLSYHAERKGIQEFETVINRLNADSTSLNVEIAGTGPLADKSKSLAQQHGNIAYYGYVSESEKRHILERAAIFVLPSRAECVPLAILEAMAGGTAVVSTSVGGIPEIVTENHGILVPPGDVDSLTEAISALLENPDWIEEISERNRQLVKDQYDWAIIADRLLTHYEQLIER